MKKIVLIVSLTIVSYNSAQTLNERAAIAETYTSNGEIKNVISKYYEFHKIKIKKLKERGIADVIKSNGKTYVLRSVSDNGHPIYIGTHNLNAAESTQTQYLHNNGGEGLNLEGQNMVVGIWDEKVALANHLEFLEDGVSVVQTETSSLNDNSDHGTHVLGTMIARGINPNAKGMAPKASAISYDWYDDIEEVEIEASNGLLLSNHSYGAPIFINGSTNVSPNQIGTYTSEAAIWDGIHHSYPYYLQVVSAGNDGSTENIDATQNGFDQLIGEKVGKNNLVVANTQDVSFYSNGFVYTQINPSSSKGPADDGRIKPDITGNGTTLFSSSSDESDSNIVNSYNTKTGTSMAAPNVTGSLLLLQQYYKEINNQFLKSATLKGLICHTAIDKGQPGPDPIFGWGVLNTKAAARIITEDINKPYIIESKIDSGQIIDYDIELSSTIEELAVTICWTDPPGTSSNTLNSLSPVIVNDIDLKITKNNQEFFPFKLTYNENDKIWSWATTGNNNVDTVEQIRIQNPATGSYNINISHKGNLRNNTQDFSLIITGYDNSNTLNIKQDDRDLVYFYPNPAKGDWIYFNGVSEGIKVNIYTINGKLILNKQVIDKLDISTFDSGIYLISLQQDNVSFFRKLIVK